MEGAREHRERYRIVVDGCPLPEHYGTEEEAVKAAAEYAEETGRSVSVYYEMADGGRRESMQVWPEPGDLWSS
jgi:hypothetical protein